MMLRSFFSENRLQNRGAHYTQVNMVVSLLVTNDRVVSFVVTKHREVYSSPE